ncbi:hypothetical protein O6H91_02G088700 [Diphasiastrum complanatum]|uniref:Uncharacterized protein n=1 Tax=Diphasiastrum complanatum TaxID=34168 RepID=A0ACC2EHY5_DIPCM|nr:hypothetical protein O6H91_02G088700 [Diphasiastrum complanatum]
MSFHLANETPPWPLDGPEPYPLRQPPPVAHPSSGSSKTSVLTPSVVAVIALLGAAFLLVSYYRILARYCTAWQYFWGLRWRRQSVSAGDDENVDFEQAWVVLTHGLDEVLIRKIPVFVYKKGEGLTESTECIVCLAEFQEEEKLRLLPKCSHAFHLPCVDMWLQTHSNCPLCRANIFSDIGVPQQQGPTSDPGLDESIFIVETDLSIPEVTLGDSACHSPEHASEATHTVYVTSSANEDVGREPTRKDNSYASGSTEKNAFVFSVGETTPQEPRQDMIRRTLTYKRFSFSLLRRSNSTGSYVSVLPETVNGVSGNLTSTTARGSAISSFSPEFRNCLPSLARQRSLSFCTSCDRGSSSNTAAPWLTQISPSRDVEQQSSSRDPYDNLSLGKSRMKTPFMSSSLSGRRVHPFESDDKHLLVTEIEPL